MRRTTSSVLASFTTMAKLPSVSPLTTADSRPSGLKAAGVSPMSRRSAIVGFARRLRFRRLRRAGDEIPDHARPRRAEEPAVGAEGERRARPEPGHLRDRRAGPRHLAHRLAQLAHHVDVDAGLRHRVVRRRPFVASRRDGAQALAGPQVQDPFAGRGVEQGDTVAEARRDPAAVAAERQRRRTEIAEVHVEAGLGQRAHLAPRAGLDQIHRPGPAERIDAGGQQRAVGTERDAAHAQPVVRRQLLQLTAGCDVEHAQPAGRGEVPGAALDELGDQEAAVRTEAQIGRARQVAGELERLDFLARRDVEDPEGPGAQTAAEPHYAVLVGEASAQGRQLAVRRQGGGHLVHRPRSP